MSCATLAGGRAGPPAGPTNRQPTSGGGPDGLPRISLPLDPVRVELACALRLGIPVIPVCVDGAAMPAAADLDAEIGDLLEFTAADLSDARWAYDVRRLIAAIDSVGGTASSPTPPATAAAEYVIRIDSRAPRVGARWPVQPIDPDRGATSLPRRSPLALAAYALSPDTARLAVARREADPAAAVEVWDCADRSLSCRLPHAGRVDTVVMAPNGDVLARSRHGGAGRRPSCGTSPRAGWSTDSCVRTRLSCCCCTASPRTTASWRDDLFALVVRRLGGRDRRGGGLLGAMSPAPPPGFEPGPSEPKSEVLPLHHGGQCPHPGMSGRAAVPRTGP